MSKTNIKALVLLLLSLSYPAKVKAITAEQAIQAIQSFDQYSREIHRIFDPSQSNPSSQPTIPQNQPVPTNSINGDFQTQTGSDFEVDGEQFSELK